MAAREAGGGGGLPADPLAPKSACFIGAKGSRKLFVRHLSLKGKLKGSNLRAPDPKTLQGRGNILKLSSWSGTGV